MNSEELKLKKAFLVQRQNLPLKLKIALTKTRIEQFYNYFNGNVYISFSGGKDSTVLKHIAETLYPDIQSVFIDTGLEYPEIRNFVSEYRYRKFSIKEQGYMLPNLDGKFDCRSFIPKQNEVE